MNVLDIINSESQLNLLNRFAKAFDRAVVYKHGQRRYRCTYFDHYLQQCSYTDRYGVKFSIRDNLNFEPSSVEDLRVVATVVARNYATHGEVETIIRTHIVERDIIDRDVWECTVIVIEGSNRVYD